MAPTAAELIRQSLEQPDDFWAEQARRIDWQRPFDRVCDTSNPPFVQWFPGGLTNLCHNAVDRHAAADPDRAALTWVSTEVDQERTWTTSQLLREVMTMAAALQELGVRRGDRVLLYMPMIPEATFAMLACARLGAIHSVVFGGFASASLAARIDDARPLVIVSADAGSRGGKVIPYKPLLDAAIEQSTHKPAHVVMVDRGLAPCERVAGRDVAWSELRGRHADAQVPCTWVDATHTSYTLYTSGTTGRPKGVQRDTGGYAVALAASIALIFDGRPGETYFCTSDIGWVVGHSYIVYGPLIAGMTTLMVEGLPTQGLGGQPDGGIWWRLVEKYKVSVMFSSPTAIRVLKKQDPALLKRHDLSSLRALFLAGEPLDAPTAEWITQGIGKPVIDNYWQTESGWPILTLLSGVESVRTRLGSPGKAVYGYRAVLLDEATGEELAGADQKGVLALRYPLPPGCMQTVWGDDDRFVDTYWRSIPNQQVYSTFDWAVRDKDGYFFILGRTDDVINVAGHRLGTREIEEAVNMHPNVAECAVVGVADPLKGQVATAFVVAKDATGLDEPAARLRLEGEIMKTVDR
ncbi:MAG TPA: propionate--CoA ligase, partial [Burkholderiaceae bacterium]